MLINIYITFLSCKIFIVPVTFVIRNKTHREKNYKVTFFTMQRKNAFLPLVFKDTL